MNGTNGGIDTSTSARDRNSRRRRVEVGLENVRYFLPKSGTSSDSPELGQEIGTEGEALVQAFKSGQVFFTVVAWRAVPEMNGSEPKIVKQALSPT